MAIPDSYYSLQEKSAASTAWGQNYAAHTDHGITAWMEYSDSILLAARKVLLIVDVQGKFAHLMHEKEHLFENITKVIKGAQSLDVPILFRLQPKAQALHKHCRSAMPHALCSLPHALCPML
jgi:isochorismate hydrolase